MNAPLRLLYTLTISALCLAPSLSHAQYYGRSTDADASPIMGNMNSDLLQQVMQMEEELRRLRGQIEKNDYEIKRLKSERKAIDEDVEFRLRALEGNPAPKDTPSNNSNIAPSGGISSSLPGTHIEVHGASSRPTTAGSGVLNAPSASGNEPRRLYNEAFRLLNQNRYDASAKAFADFTQQYPKDPLIGNAYYWLGETYYIQKNYVEAADKFREGYQTLPDGPKAPDNLLKLAMSLKALDRISDACTVAGQIGKKFKDAPAGLLKRAASERKLMGCE